MIKPLVWSEPENANEEVRYNHVSADTPFGQILITWKGWKEFPSFDVDDHPVAGVAGHIFEQTLEATKAQCEQRYKDAVLSQLDEQSVYDVEHLAQKIYTTLEYNGPNTKPEWVVGGNSLKQDEARKKARDLLS